MSGPLDEHTLAGLLNRVAAGETPVEQALDDLRHMPYEQVDGAKLDHHRELRTGQVEAIYGPGKSLEQIGMLAATLAARASGAVFVTRATEEQSRAVQKAVPDAEYDEVSGLIVVKPAPSGGNPAGTVAVITAGTADRAIANEAALTAEALGLRVERIEDVGIAGLHRLLDQREAIGSVDCCIVVAGMEGALPSLVAGMTSRPVVAVPTSVGYGAAFEGMAALLGMLTGCAPGVAIVNIDNGFGAAQVAHRMLSTARDFRSGADSARLSEPTP
jgi:hypothetical protein